MLLRRDLSAAIVIAAATGVVAVLAAGRTYLTFGTESDFVGTFVPAAERVGTGGPLLLTFHPPLYPVVLALVRALVGDWMVAGLVISVLAFAAGLGAAYALFRLIGLSSAAWGALLALATSPLYVYYGAQATSDVFFSSLYALALLLVVRAWHTGTKGAWFVAGVAIALATLTRTNGLSLLLLAAAPLVQLSAGRDRFGRTAAVACGAALTLATWGAVALATASPLWPTRTGFNLALTYLAPGTDRMSLEAAATLPDSLPGVGRLLLSQPGMVAHTYARDAAAAIRRVLRGDQLTLLPVGVLLLPGLVLVFRMMDRRLATVLAVATLAQAAVLNLKAYEPRYFIFALPLIGAAAAAVVWAVWERLQATGPRVVAVALPAGVAGVVLLGAMADVRAQLHSQDAELGEVVPVARQLLDPGGVLCARNVLLAYYTGAVRARFPTAGTPDELRAGLARMSGRPLYLFFGSEESRRRPELRSLLRPDSAPPWLRPLAHSRQPGAWVLYQYAPGAAVN